MEGSFKPTYKDLTDPKVIEELVALGEETKKICQDHPEIHRIVWKDGTTSWPDGSAVPNTPPPVIYLPLMSEAELQDYREKTKYMAPTHEQLHYLVTKKGE